MDHPSYQRLHQLFDRIFNEFVPLLIGRSIFALGVRHPEPTSPSPCTQKCLGGLRKEQIQDWLQPIAWIDTVSASLVLASWIHAVCRELRWRIVGVQVRLRENISLDYADYFFASGFRPLRWRVGR